MTWSTIDFHALASQKSYRNFNLINDLLKLIMLSTDSLCVWCTVHNKQRGTEMEREKEKLREEVVVERGGEERKEGWLLLGWESVFSWLEGERRIVSLDGRKRPCSGTDKVTEAHYCHSLTIPAAIFYSHFFCPPLCQTLLFAGIIMAVSAPCLPAPHTPL